MTGVDSPQLAALVEAADALLLYLRGHWTGLGADRGWWAQLGRLQFVPATLGVPGEAHMCMCVCVL